MQRRWPKYKPHRKLKTTQLGLARTNSVSTAQLDPIQLSHGRLRRLTSLSFPLISDDNGQLRLWLGTGEVGMAESPWGTGAPFSASQATRSSLQAPLLGSNRGSQG